MLSVARKLVCTSFWKFSNSSKLRNQMIVNIMSLNECLADQIWNYSGEGGDDNGRQGRTWSWGLKERREAELMERLVMMCVITCNWIQNVMWFTQNSNWIKLLEFTDLGYGCYDFLPHCWKRLVIVGKMGIPLTKMDPHPLPCYTVPPSKGSHVLMALG